MRLLPHQVEEQEGDEPPPVVERRVARSQPRREMQTKHLEQSIDTLTKLVSTLVAALGQNAANVAPAIPSRIPLANAEGKRAGTPRPARPELTLALGTDFETLTELFARTANPP